jgi:hypothetical protein
LLAFFNTVLLATAFDHCVHSHFLSVSLLAVEIWFALGRVQAPKDGLIAIPRARKIRFQQVESKCEYWSLLCQPRHFADSAQHHGMAVTRHAPYTDRLRGDIAWM